MTPAEIKQLLSTTISKHKKRLYDNVTKGNLILWMMDSKGRITSIDGGVDIRVPVLFDEENFTWYEGADPLSRATKGVITEAVYDPAMAAASVTLTGEELAKNKGASVIVKLLRGRIENAENTIKSQITTAIYSDGTTPKSFIGLAALVSPTPAVGTVAGIDAATVPVWRNEVETVELESKPDGANPRIALTEEEKRLALRSAMNRLYRKATVGTEKPDVITLDGETFDLFERSLQEQQRYASSKAAEVGFMTLRFKGASVTAEDEGVGHPTDGGYMLNTDFLGLEHYQGRGFDPLDISETTPDVDAITKHIAFMGAPTMTKRNRQGRLVVTRTPAG